MKRTVTFTVACVAILALACSLCGCSSLGIGTSSTYTPQKKSAQVSTPTVGQTGVLRVGVNSSNTPFSTQVSGKVVGLDVDVAAALADEMGLDLQIVDVGSDPEGALADGTVDIVMNMDKSDTAVSCWLSDPYVQTAVALFATASDATMPTVASKPSIEAQSASMSAWEVSTQFGDSSLKTTTDLKTAFSDLKGGTTKYVAADAVIGSYVNYTSASGAKIIGLMQKSGGYCIGVANSNSDLKTAVSNALSSVSNQGVLSVIETKWLGSDLNLSGYSLTDTASKSTSGSSSSSTDNDASSSVTEAGANAVSLGSSRNSSSSSSSSASTATPTITVG
jgi:polar amino acid transport system substrate-binding protein